MKEFTYKGKELLQLFKYVFFNKLTNPHPLKRVYFKVPITDYLTFFT